MIALAPAGNATVRSATPGVVEVSPIVISASFVAVTPDVK